jgi:predicted nucleic acid-binding protein
MILIDTPAWIDFFRGREPIAGLVDAALAHNEAALCGPVQAELRRGLANERERNQVLPLLDGCHVLDQPERLWSEAGDLGFALRRRGVSAKTVDLLIAIYALSHASRLLTTDKDFAAMQRAGVSLQLVSR